MCGKEDSCFSDSQSATLLVTALVTSGFSSLVPNNFLRGGSVTVSKTNIY